MDQVLKAMTKSHNFRTHPFDQLCVDQSAENFGTMVTESQNSRAHTFDQLCVDQNAEPLVISKLWVARIIQSL